MIILHTDYDDDDDDDAKGIFRWKKNNNLNKQQQNWQASKNLNSVWSCVFGENLLSFKWTKSATSLSKSNIVHKNYTLRNEHVTITAHNQRGSYCQFNLKSL